MKRFKNPRCNAPDYDESGTICGVEMKIVGERHPLWKPRHWVFVCPRCDAVRAISENMAARQVEEV